MYAIIKSYNARGVCLMKKYKVKPYNSYYHYKHNKSMRIKFLIMSLICLIGMGLILGIYRNEIKNFYEEHIMVETANEKKEVQPFYFQEGPKNYHLFKVPVKVKGIYIPSRKMSELDSYLELARKTDINAFVIDIKDDEGYITFHTDNQKLVQMGSVKKNPPIKNINQAIAKMYEEDIYPIARIVAFKDSALGEKSSDRVIHDTKGNIYRTPREKQVWLNPYDKRNWAYILEIAKEAANLGFKEIQLDYVRFHESMNSDRVQLDPNKSKATVITEFINYMSEELKEYNVYVSADVFGAIITSKRDGEIVGQDYRQMVKKLDYISPMVYPSHYGKGSFGIEYPDLSPYDIILGAMEASSDVIKQNPREERKAIVRPWLQDFTASWLDPHQKYGKKQIQDQIKATYDAGLDEWILWNSSGRYTESALLNE